MNLLLNNIIDNFVLFAEGYTIASDAQVKRNYKLQADLLHTLIVKNVDFEGEPITDEQVSKVVNAGKKLGYIFP